MISDLVDKLEFAVIAFYFSVKAADDILHVLNKHVAAYLDAKKKRDAE